MKKSLFIGLAIYMGVFLAGTAFGQTTYATISGTVHNCDYGSNPQNLVAMVLANGQYMFSNNPVGEFSLHVPLDSNGEITLQVFAAGFTPFRKVFTPEEASDVDVTLLRCLQPEICSQGASVVFLNNLICGSTHFTATATVCGVSIDSETGEWSDCISVTPGSCNVSVYADAGNCGELELSGTIVFQADCLTVLVFGFIDDEIDVGVSEICPGDCSTDPDEVFNIVSSSYGASFKIETAGGIEGEGFTLSRIKMQSR
ncbi:MAG: hypothetical protein JW896_09060 [Deltaproteobacteria bacterium]|nr:hypothetical protein [Deltaproteobacteria bacterium]